MRPAWLAAVILTIILSPQLRAAPVNGVQEQGISLILGAVVISAPQFVGNGDTRQTLPLPLLMLEWEPWFIDTSFMQLGFSIWKTNTIKLDVLMQPRYGFEPGDDPLLSDLDERGTTAEAGVRAQWSRAGYTAQWGYYTGVGGNRAGQAATAGLAYVFVHGPWALMPALVWRWEDRALVNHQYSINAAQARSDRPLYTGAATFIGGPGLTAIYQADTWIGFGNLAYQRAGGGIRHSPIVGRDDGWTVSMGVGWAL